MQSVLLICLTLWILKISKVEEKLLNCCVVLKEGRACSLLTLLQIIIIMKVSLKGSTGWKLITLALDRDPWKLYLMFLYWEINIKLCQFTRKCIYIQFCIETVGLNRSYTPPIWHSFISISRYRNIRYNFHGSGSRAKVISFQLIPPFSFP